MQCFIDHGRSRDTRITFDCEIYFTTWAAHFLNNFCIDGRACSEGIADWRDSQESHQGIKVCMHWFILEKSNMICGGICHFGWWTQVFGQFIGGIVSCTKILSEGSKISWGLNLRRNERILAKEIAQTKDGCVHFICYICYLNKDSHGRFITKI